MACVAAVSPMWPRCRLCGRGVACVAAVSPVCAGIVCVRARACAGVSVCLRVRTCARVRARVCMRLCPRVLCVARVG